MQLLTPPHSLEAEQVLLAALIERNTLVDDLEDVLNENYFYRHNHQIIYRAISAMALKGKPVDLPLLVDHLDASGDLDEIGGAEYLIDIIQNSRGPSNARHYAQTIRDRWIMRQLINKGQSIAELGFNGESAEEAIQEAQAQIMDFEQSNSQSTRTLNQILTDVVDRIDYLTKNRGKITGLKTGYADLDRHIGGLEKTDLVIVAGRPGMGKTVCAMNFAETATLEGKNVLVFSLEMSSDQLLTRSACSIGRISNDRVRKGALEDEDWPKLTVAISRIKDKSLTVDDRVPLTSEQALSRARKVVRQTGRPLDLIVIDYIQLLKDKGEELDRITRITNNLKGLAKSMNCPVVALSQLNRECEKRPNKRPQMSDLRASGSIEQDADIIMFLYRDEVYNPDSDQKGVVELNVAKFRNGSPGVNYLASRLEYFRFDDLTNYTPPPAPMKKSRGGV